MLVFELNEQKKCDVFNITFKNLKVFTETINIVVTKPVTKSFFSNQLLIHRIWNSISEFAKFGSQDSLASAEDSPS